MKNILVFPCGSEIGLEIHKSLEYSTHFTLIGASSVEDHGKYVYKNYVGDIPLVDDPDFTKKINEVIDEYKIDCIIPAHDSVLLRLAEEKEAGKLLCEVMAPPLPTCRITRSKRETYQLFNDILLVPEVYEQGRIENKLFPVFLKPDVGQGSKGTYLAKDSSDVEFYVKKDPSLMILEYLPGKEFTVDCLTNSKGELLFCEGRVRSRISNGISVSSATIVDKRFLKIARKISSKLPLRGAWFFQLKENNKGDLVLLEIAPRIAGTMGLVRCKGVNLVLLSLFDLYGLDVDITENKYGMTIDRALQNRYWHDIVYRHVYLDFDDLVIIDEKVNPIVMSYVYQCINKGIKIHLLTKHAKDLQESLRKYRLSGVFDELTHIGKDEEKYEKILEPEAIFIDDSYVERKKVFQNRGIPTFDGHMIESLMEKF